MRTQTHPHRWSSTAGCVVFGVTVSTGSAWGDDTQAAATSPGKVLEVSLQVANDGRLAYQVTRHGKPVIAASRLGFMLANGAPLEAGFKIARQMVTAHDETWEQPWGERRFVRNRYTQLRVDVRQKDAAGRRLTIVFRVFDDGVGFRYEFPKQAEMKAVHISDELTEFVVAQPATAWWQPAGEVMAFDYPIRKTLLSEVGMANTPLTLRTDDGTHIALHEAALVDYPAMWLRRVEGQKLRAHLTPSSSGPAVLQKGGFVTPWRTLQIADDAPALIMSDLILNLNEPNQLGDVSWVRPFKVDGAGAVAASGASTGLVGHHETGGHIARYESEMDATYLRCKEQGVDAITVGYAVDAGAAQFAASGGKLRYGHTGGQEGVRHFVKAVTEAARHKLSIDTLAALKDTGLRRTYPNWLSVQGARGVACHPGGASAATRAGQLANLVVTYSPLMMMLDDLIEDCERYPDALKFIRDVPTDWSDTLVVNAALGAYATIARKDRRSDDWYVGALTDGFARVLPLPLDFLDAGKTYLAEIYRDGEQRADLLIQRRTVTPTDKLTLRLTPGGGQAIRLTPQG